MPQYPFEEYTFYLRVSGYPPNPPRGEGVTADPIKFSDTGDDQHPCCAATAPDIAIILARSEVEIIYD